MEQAQINDNSQTSSETLKSFSPVPGQSNPSIPETESSTVTTEGFGFLVGQVNALHDQIEETRAVVEDIHAFLQAMFPSREIKG